MAPATAEFWHGTPRQDITWFPAVDAQAFLPMLRDLARRNGFVLVNEMKG
jgi:hypothetical protein